MWLRTSNLYTHVTQATEEERTWIREFLSVRDNQQRFRKNPDGKLVMYNLLKDTFPTGFSSMVVKHGREQGFEVRVLDQRTPPCAFDPTADLEWLHHHPATPDEITHQVDAVMAVVKKTRGIVKSPTGSGKTEVICGLVKSLPCRWLFLVHRSGLMHQTAKRFAARTGGEECNVVGDSLWEDRGHRFTVATFQTLSIKLAAGDKRAKALLAETEGILIDEAHTLPAATFFRVAMSTPKAYWRVGLSGTPLDRGDRRSILAIAALGQVCFSIESKELIEKGILARPKIRMQVCDHPPSEDLDWELGRSSSARWNDVYQDRVVGNATRNALLVAAAKRCPKPALLFVKDIAHGKLLEQGLRAAKVKAEFVWGDTNTASRDAAVQRLANGVTEVLVCSVIFQEGVDIPELQSVVVGSGGKSVIAALQRIGRGMRTGTDKKTFEVHDVLDQGQAALERHSKARRHAYVRQGYEVVVDSASGTLALF